MKTHKNQRLLNPLSPMIAVEEPRTRAPPMVSEVQTPSQWPDRGQLPEMWAYKPFRTPHFHGVSSASPHAYSLRPEFAVHRHMNVLFSFISSIYEKPLKGTSRNVCIYVNGIKARQYTTFCLCLGRISLLIAQKCISQIKHVLSYFSISYMSLRISMCVAKQ